jgi:hypothetical protein
LEGVTGRPEESRGGPDSEYPVNQCQSADAWQEKLSDSAAQALLTVSAAHPRAESDERNTNIMTTTLYMKTMAGKALLSSAVALAGLALASGTAHAQRNNEPHVECHYWGGMYICEMVPPH